MLRTLLVLLLALPAASFAATPPSFCPKAKPQAAASASQSAARAQAEKARSHWARLLSPDHRKGIDEWSPKQNAEAVGNYGATLATAGWREPGLYMLASSALRSPKSASLWAKLGAFMQQEKETRPGAEAVLRYALSLSDREPSANANLAGILYDRGDLEGAKKHWTVAVEYAPVVDAPKLGLAAVAACQGDAKGARAWLEKAEGGTARWLKAWKSMVPDAPPPPGKTPSQTAETAKKAQPGQSGPKRAGDLSVDGGGRPPMFDTDTGKGLRPPPAEGPPHASEPVQMQGLKGELIAYERVATKLERERAKASNNFESRYLNNRTFLPFNWTQWRLGQLVNARLYLNKEMGKIEAEERRLGLHRAQAIKPPDYGAYQERREKCQRANSSACDRRAVEEYCSALSGYYQTLWTTNHGDWNNLTTARLEAADAFYYRVTDAIHHWADRKRYAEAVAWAEELQWRIRAEAAGDLQMRLQQIPLELAAARGDPIWCDNPYVERKDDDEAPDPALSRLKSPMNWCPDSASKSFSAGFAEVTVGCQEVALRVNDGPLFGECSYNIKDEAYTVYVGAGGSVANDKLKLEGGVFVTVDKGGSVDIGAKGSAKAFDAVSAEGKISGEGYSAEAKVFNEKVFEKKGGFYPVPDASTPYVKQAPP